VPHSITRRLLVSNLLVLATFLGLAGAALDRAFRSSSETAVRERLQAHVYTLLATAEDDEQGRMRLPEGLSAPAFNTPDSGLYAEVVGEDGAYRWRSASMIGSTLDLARGAAPGEARFRLTPRLATLEFGIAWEDDAGTAIPYSLAVATDTRALQIEQSTFRGTLWRWLGGLAVLLLLVQIMLARWGLSPLHAMSQAVRRIEAGQSAAIEGPVAVELKGLSNNLNALIRQARTRQERVRNSLADLAHSMKTPLAVLRGAAENDPDPERRGLLVEQTERIDQIVSYQRQRAAVAGSNGVAPAIELAPIVRRLISGLDKVHSGRGVQCELDIDAGLLLRADQGDLFELFGNLLENAYKHARARIMVEVRQTAESVRIRIEDDGPGIPVDDAARLLRRGQRADQRHAGEGIGLAVVNEIVSQYDGELSIGRASLGGAVVEVGLPR
jgi:two-component system sensor histidine kinase PhoQ